MTVFLIISYSVAYEYVVHMNIQSVSDARHTLSAAGLMTLTVNVGRVWKLLIISLSQASAVCD